MKEFEKKVAMFLPVSSPFVLYITHIFDIQNANEWFSFLKEKGELKALSTKRLRNKDDAFLNYEIE